MQANQANLHNTGTLEDLFL